MDREATQPPSTRRSGEGIFNQSEEVMIATGDLAACRVPNKTASQRSVAMELRVVHNHEFSGFPSIASSFCHSPSSTTLDNPSLRQTPTTSQSPNMLPAHRREIDLADAQFRSASATGLPGARDKLIAAVKKYVHHTDADHGKDVKTETWTTDELEAANQVLRRNHHPTISKEDTAVWHRADGQGHDKLTFYATPSCRWLPAIGEAACTRIKRMEAEMGREAARKAWAPPFVVLLLSGQHCVCLVPECVMDLQRSPVQLRCLDVEGMRGLVPMPAAVLGYRGS